MNSTEYLYRLRKNEGLKYAILKKITVSGLLHTVSFSIVTDRVFTNEDRAAALALSQECAPEGYRAEVEIEKLVADPDIVKKRMKEILSRKFPAANAFLRDEDIYVTSNPAVGEVKIVLRLASHERILLGDKTIDQLRGELQKHFCGAFAITVEGVEKECEREEALPEEESFVVACRYFDIEEFEPIDGEEEPKCATYIADGALKEGNMHLCGAIRMIVERETQKGKPFFQFTLDDGTGSMRVVYFTRKRTYDKIKALKEGDWIVCSGVNERFRDSLSFHVKNINYGRQRTGFVPEKRACRPVPKTYKTVFPEPYSDSTQDDLFGKEPLPEAFRAQEFVVFDLETTGLNNNPLTGNMDSIIEIGAVRIRGGEVVEKFSTFVACHKKLSEEIVSLTGISDEMLEGAPEIGDAIVDFYKFCNGSPMVGHNVMFDYKFVSHYGEKEDVRFDVKLYDTLTIAQRELHLSNYKLNTLADYYGVTFRHHRAFDDALATAKIFIELIRGKKCLPN